MKEIKAIIRPFKLLEVIEALKSINKLPGVTISEIIGFGKDEPQTSNEKVLYVPRTKLEVVVDDNIADDVINTIQQAAFTGNPGDGKIFVTTVEDVVRIRTNEHGVNAV